MRFLSLFLVFLSLPLALLATPEVTVYNYNSYVSAPTSEDLHRGYVDRQGSDPSQAPIIISVQGGPAWKLYVRSPNPYLVPTNLRKPISDFMWKHNQEPNNAWRRLTTSEQLVLDGSAPPHKGTIYLDLKALVDWEDPPADYQASLEFILRRA